MPNCCTSGRAVVMSTMTCWFCVDELDLELMGRAAGRAPPVKSKIRSFCSSTAMRASGVPLGASIGSTVDRAQALAQARAAGQRLLAVERLEAAGQQAAKRQRGRQTRRSGRPSLGGQATTFTILCGTTMTFFGRLPSSAFCTASSASTAASISAAVGVARHGDVGPLLAVDLDRQSNGVLDQQGRLDLPARARRRPGCRGRAPPSIPRPGAASSGGTAAP